MCETIPPWEVKGTRYRHRVPDLIEEFEDEDLEQFALSAERAADNPELDIVDLSELYGAADTVREAAIIKRRRQRQQRRN